MRTNPAVQRPDRLAIGITCYPSFGGSGIIATDIGLAMAARGHRVHFITRERPRRLDERADAMPGVTFHRVEAPGYPVFGEAPYTVALASAMASVATAAKLDVLHVHYAVPHAASAWMARAMLGAEAPALVTTLHGTDVTVVGCDDSYRPATRHAIAASDAVTAPSAFLRDAAWDGIGLDREGTPIEVIPNFVDTDRYAPAVAGDDERLAALWDGDPSVPVVVHVSNFRPIKRVPRVVELFAAVRARHRARLLLIGDGPERAAVEAQVTAHGLGDDVRLVGKQEHFEAWLRACAVFVLPSESESFGLAALEALSSGVPVVASAVGGLGEVVQHGETGWLAGADDIGGMAERIAALVADPALRARMGAAARADVLSRFCAAPMVERYEAVYRRVVAGRYDTDARGRKSVAE
ncbi:MAG: N-acetyl-alpha-D-glucosaminyl L-malate synthase BshA [Myxococcales bacterium]|nr:N-acetyl-alpha-D-glucosaminyl L-malate synthase BshA [Myxococcales bacterium]